MHSNGIDNESFVALLYRVILHREPDPAGLVAHLGRLRSGEIGYEGLTAEFLSSDELKAKGITLSNFVTGSDSTRSYGLGIPDPSLADCVFYHTMELPDGEVIPGYWDLRGHFERYIGETPLRDKSVLDVGTATGFLAFEAEKRGARVTAFDIDSGSYQANIPFAGYRYHEDRDGWIWGADQNLRGLHNSFWYCHKRYQSRVQMIYGSFNDLRKRGQQFDIVLAGALFEHLSDPVTVLGTLAKLARETLVIAWTPIILSEDIFMRPCVPWDNPKFDFSWYEMSVGMYRRLLANLGFRIHAIHIVNALYLTDNVMAERPTIVAKRIV